MFDVMIAPKKTRGSACFEQQPLKNLFGVHCSRVTRRCGRDPECFEIFQNDQNCCGTQNDPLHVPFSEDVCLELFWVRKVSTFLFRDKMGWYFRKHQTLSGSGRGLVGLSNFIIMPLVSDLGKNWKGYHDAWETLKLGDVPLLKVEKGFQGPLAATTKFETKWYSTITWLTITCKNNPNHMHMCFKTYHPPKN